MSRIGKLPIILPQGVTLEVAGREVKVVGPKGSLVRRLAHGISVEVKDGVVQVQSTGKTKQDKSNFGSSRAHIANMAKGVSEGWKKVLELVGTGYRAEATGNSLTLTIGYSHPVKVEGSDNISFKVEKSIITIEGIDKEEVGEVAAKVRAVRPPEPYKGKGIKYLDEVIRRKAGKAAKTVGAPA
ncbi:MAG TPA: 50S ribosomal protein L6 [Patescibacteria group bacterium]|uniref:Large ribosomal subunit protein uL6 n=1 Tax=Candidatus Woesebacteria bacterium RBG_13_46_13 TaxID=1802479 RepID=A0A1F7X7J1_9BACT|nr:MAG: 50S ribosomal protein L6 [Candidatus Woesebacteria bacterium RBG_13_46_13]HJX59152.1 50S ribosomal protein L6 [Patescibacteria group bacterium]